MSDLRIIFYGDDFTGSTDAMESLARAGLKTVLFTDPPTRAQLDQFPHAQAWGIAGMTRAMPPEEMATALWPAFARMKELGAPIIHYKTCSTFDSSPAIGSIGRVIEVGMKLFQSTAVPVLVGAPGLGRYCVFGNLFARCGEETEPYRLDRHPSMSRHPTTPMNEADLTRHLAKQTALSITLFDVLQYALPIGEIEKAFAAALSSRSATAAGQVVLMDMLLEAHLPLAGKLLASAAQLQRPMFVVGSSGVESALCAHWQATGTLQPPVSFAKPTSNGAILAVCGSCSPVTAGQIRWAIENGFVEVELDVARPNLSVAANAIVRALGAGKSVALHTGMGESAKRVEGANSRQIGPLLGEILKTVLAGAPALRRVIVAGGDTSGQVARAVGIRSLEMIAELTRGSPLCRVNAPGTPADGIEITFKGGQIGKPDFFGFVRG